MTNNNSERTKNKEFFKDIIMIKVKEKNYEDITNIYEKNLKLNKGKVHDAKCYEHHGKKYYVDGKKVILDYTLKEKEVGMFLARLLNKDIYMLPKVNYPKNIQTSDYMVKDTNEKWDLKEIKGNGNRNIDSKIKLNKEQANNFIIDNSKQKILNKDLIKQVEKIYDNPIRRKWLKQIILIERNKLIKAYKRK